MTVLNKNLLTCVLIAAFSCTAAAQTRTTPSKKTATEARQQVPADPAVRIGKLSNGLTYYIRKNAEPKNRAELYLVNKIGSIVENDDQLGLAHFTEHMAFNGTRDFPKNEIVSYLQRAGVRFGADLNAYTGFNQTVYQLPLPTDSTEIFRKGFDILANWAGYVTFEDKEIDQERGVIVEEDRQRGKNAQERMSKQLLPVLLANSRYAERLPIGKVEILQSFKYETIRQFYRDWYRPNLQAVIAVGDFDVSEVEKLIRENFSGLKNPAKERPRPEYGLPGNKAPLARVVTDPEYPYVVAQVTYKHPEVIEKTTADLRSNAMTSMINSMLGARISEIIQKGNAPFLFAQSTYGPYQGGLVNADAFTSVAVAKDAGELEKAFNAVLAENVRMKKYGFTQSELDRAKQNLLTGAEKMYKEKDKTKSSVFVQDYVQHFLTGEAIPSIDYTYEFYQKVLPAITLTEINRMAASFITDENRVLIVQAPEKEKDKLPTEQTLVKWADNAGKDVAAYVDNVVNKPLMAAKPAAGKLVSEKTIPEVGVTELTLSNGVKVVLKPTDFKNDQILFTATSPGGTSLATDQDYLSADQAAQLIDASGISEFDATQLSKLLTGKVVNVTPGITSLREGLTGAAAPKDLETALQLTYLYFTAPRKDPNVFRTQMDEMKTILAGRPAQPAAVYQDTVAAVLSSYNKRGMTPTVADLGAIDLDKAFSFYKDRFADASDFTFFFVGNFKPEEIRPMLETYLGGLPSIKRKENYRDLGIEPLKGKVTRTVYKGLENKATVSLMFHGNYDYSDDSNLMLDALKEVLDIKITERLREKESGVYSPGVSVSYSKEPKARYSIGIYFSCAAENVEKLVAAALDEVNKLKQSGATPEDIQKFVAEEKRQFELQSRDNNFWLNYLRTAYTQEQDPKKILTYPQTLSKVTVPATKEAAGKFLSGENFMRLVLMPEEKK
ncbi:MAG TPA: insulinase family protein [Sphingobacteriaceae bacterium]